MKAITTNIWRVVSNKILFWGGQICVFLVISVLQYVTLIVVNNSFLIIYIYIYTHTHTHTHTFYILFFEDSKGQGSLTCCRPWGCKEAIKS